MQLPGEAIQGPQCDPHTVPQTKAKQSKAKDEKGKLYAYSTPTNEIHKQGMVVQFCNPALGRHGQAGHEFKVIFYHIASLKPASATPVSVWLFEGELPPQGHSFHFRDVERAHWVKVLAAQPGDLSSIHPRTHVRVGQEKQFLKVVL